MNPLQIVRCLLVPLFLFLGSPSRNGSFILRRHHILNSFVWNLESFFTNCCSVLSRSRILSLRVKSRTIASLLRLFFGFVLKLTVVQSQSLCKIGCVVASAYGVTHIYLPYREGLSFVTRKWSNNSTGQGDSTGWLFFRRHEKGILHETLKFDGWKLKMCYRR